MTAYEIIEFIKNIVIENSTEPTDDIRDIVYRKIKSHYPIECQSLEKPIDVGIYFSTADRVIIYISKMHLSFEINLNEPKHQHIIYMI